MTIRAELERFILERYPNADRQLLAGDASTRRFVRVRPADAGPSVVLMDYGAAFEGETDDVRLTRVFRAANLPVAEIVEVVPEVGCLVLSDLGDRLLEGELAAESSAADEPPPVLVHAVDLAAAIAERGTAVLRTSDRADGPALDAERFRFEMGFFVEHFVCGRLGRHEIDPSLRRSLEDLADGAAQTPRMVLCHRDFHSRNILVGDDEALTLVDIQDARWGPDSYDLASLLFDAYVDIEPGWIAPLIERYLAGLSEPPSEGDFTRRLEQVAAQRMIKALGTFGYQAGVRGAIRYESAIPRTLSRLDALLPELTETHRLHRLLSDAGVLGFAD